MARLVTTIQIEAELHNRIANIRGAVSTELRFNERSLGLGPMLGLLVDHWLASPPSAEWLRERAALYPRRGRPPKHIKGTMRQSSQGPDPMRGHDVLEVPRPGLANKLYICKGCNMQWGTWDFDRPPALCPAGGRISSIYVPKRWKKNELLAMGFREDQVEWADP